MGALLNYNIRETSGFVIAAGAILGVCAGLLWTAQGTLTLAYATESTKGRLFALFWSVPLPHSLLTTLADPRFVDAG